MQADFYQTAAPGAMEKISRAEAKAQGLKRFFTGEPCMHGHVAPRYVSNKRCVVCNQKPYDEKRRNYGAAWRKANKQRCAQYSTAYRERNPSVSAEYMRRIRAKKGPRCGQKKGKNTLQILRNTSRRTRPTVRKIQNIMRLQRAIGGP